MKLKLLNTLFLLIVVAFSASAQDVPRRVQKSYNIFFEVNSSKVDYSYKSNSRTLDQLKADCEKTLTGGVSVPDTIWVHATSSPDGSQVYNYMLAHSRALAAMDKIIEMVPAFKDCRFVIDYHVEDWDGLMQVLMSDSDFPQRDQMIHILQESASYPDLHKSLKECEQGWAYFVEHHIHALRNSSIMMTVLSDNPNDEFVRGGRAVLHAVCPMEYMPTFVAPASAIIPVETQTEVEWRKMIMAAKTNLLVPGMSVGLEFPIKDNWSVGLDYYFPWVLPKSNKWCLEMIAGFVGAKYWFPGKNYKWTRTERLQGHALGVYGGVGYYDFQRTDDGQQGEFVDFGVDYTFALPVAKGKLRMEFNIGVGFVRSWYRPYYMSSDFEDLIKEPGILYNTTNFIGPTKGGVSLVVPIVAKTKAPKAFRKGGER